jgi:hypothetical protein
MLIYGEENPLMWITTEVCYMDAVKIRCLSYTTETS